MWDYFSYMKYSILLVIFFICFAFSILVSFVHVSGVCGPNSSGCEIVSKTKYSKILGLDVSSIGIFAFLVLMILTSSQIKNPGKRKNNLINAGIIIGSVFAAYFIYLQAVVIGAFCKYCMVVDIGILVALAVIVFDKLIELKSKWLM